MKKTQIIEEMHPEVEWFEEARNMTLEKLPDFMNHVLNDYIHDYGTIVHAVGACAVAAAWAANDVAGLTGFQAGFVMWDFIRQWEYAGNKCGLRLMNYDDMLYPQYEEKFDKTIKADTWKELQKQAKEKLKEFENDWVSPSVVRHWQSIADGTVPFGYKIISR